MQLDQKLVIPGETQSNSEISIGDAVTGFLDGVAPSGAGGTLLQDASAILAESGVTADKPSARTGLVVGRVQSGKTLSYESVIALARDNGFALVVVVSGISNPLLDQGVRRLRGDLTLADERGWNFMVNAGNDGISESSLATLRDNWLDPDTPATHKKTAVCLLLKNHGRIDKFVAACQRVDWSGIKVLIVDDEADQASLNTLAKKNKPSATYKQLLAMRSSFPHHAYLQYTATPQAPLLVAISDVLSPDFVRVIEPGLGYTGGEAYFDDLNSGLIRVISENDLEMADNADGPPPDSLLEALKFFVLGGASLLANQEAATRSMLVHPSRVTAPHATFARWIRAVRRQWLASLDDPDDSLELRREFQMVHENLRATDPLIPSLDDCWPKVRYVLRNLHVIEMNTREGAATPVIDWDETKSYVLIGGQALDRGFTVEGLSVTYMPRGPGLWNADSIQQRARFFGYKKSYVGQCRVYLESSLRDAFEKYVEHERHMLDSLRDIQSGRSSLKQWEREFYLDPRMRATRQSVISIPTIRVDPGEKWLFDSSPVTSEVGVELVAKAAKWVDSLELSEGENGHQWASTSVSKTLSFIESLSNHASSAVPNIRALKLQLAKLSDEENDGVSVVVMRKGSRSERTLTSNGRIQPFQGANKNYAGDRSIHDAGRITMQIHQFAVKVEKAAPPFAEMVVPTFWIPEDLAGGWMMEADTK